MVYLWYELPNNNIQIWIRFYNVSAVRSSLCLRIIPNVGASLRKCGCSRSINTVGGVNGGTLGMKNRDNSQCLGADVR